MLFAYVNQQGAIVETHNDSTVEQLPNGAVLLAEELFDKRFNLRWNGETWVELPQLAPPQVLPIITAFGLRQALNKLGLRKQTEAAIASADVSMMDAWEYATHFSSDHFFIVELTRILQWSEQQVEEIFKLAAASG